MSDVDEEYPTPWEIDYRPHAVPKYSVAAVYAADSTPVFRKMGIHAEALAQKVVDAVNAQDE